jgi:tetratricopeptide (TPR) repeat protein
VYTKRALALEPNNADAIDHLLWIYAIAGRTELSDPLMEHSLRIDPFTPHSHWVVGWTYVMRGNLEAGLPHFRKALEINPQNQVWRFLCGHLLYLTGHVQEGDAVMQLMQKSHPGQIFTSLMLLIKNAFQREKDATAMLY